MAACASDRRPPADTSAAASGASRSSANDTLWLFAADPAHDAVHAADTEADLIMRYGAANVRRDSILLGEGEFAAGVILFPDDSMRRVAVAWSDQANRAKPEVARVRGQKSRWVAYPGVTLGSCLEEVERINGEPFTFFGFGFDGSGMNHSWGKGRLDSLWGSDALSKRVWVRFGTDARVPRQLEGDKQLSSGDPAVRAVRPCVREMQLVPR